VNWIFLLFTSFGERCRSPYLETAGALQKRHGGCLIYSLQEVEDCWVPDPDRCVWAGARPVESSWCHDPLGSWASMKTLPS
jgi:hypothetical protein